MKKKETKIKKKERKKERKKEKRKEKKRVKRKEKKIFFLIKIFFELPRKCVCCAFYLFHFSRHF